MEALMELKLASFQIHTARFNQGNRFENRMRVQPERWREAAFLPPSVARPADASVPAHKPTERTPG